MVDEFDVAIEAFTNRVIVDDDQKKTTIMDFILYIRPSNESIRLSQCVITLTRLTPLEFVEEGVFIPKAEIVEKNRVVFEIEFDEPVSYVVLKGQLKIHEDYMNIDPGINVAGTLFGEVFPRTRKDMEGSVMQ